MHSIFLKLCVINYMFRQVSGEFPGTEKLSKQGWSQTKSRNDKLSKRGKSQTRASQPSAHQPIDPSTHQPIQQSTNRLIDPSTSRLMDPSIPFARPGGLREAIKYEPQRTAIPNVIMMSSRVATVLLPDAFQGM